MAGGRGAPAILIASIQTPFFGIVVYCASIQTPVFFRMQMQGYISILICNNGCNNGHSNFMRIASILCGCALLHVALPFKLCFLALLYVALPFKLRFIFRMQTQGYICILICNNGCNNGHSNLQQCLQQSQHQCLDFFWGGLQQWLQG